MNLGRIAWSRLRYMWPYVLYVVYSLIRQTQVIGGSPASESSPVNVFISIMTDVCGVAALFWVTNVGGVSVLPQWWEKHRDLVRSLRPVAVWLIVVSVGYTWSGRIRLDMESAVLNLSGLVYLAYLVRLRLNNKKVTDARRDFEAAFHYYVMRLTDELHRSSGVRLDGTNARSLFEAYRDMAAENLATSVVIITSIGKVDAAKNGAQQLMAMFPELPPYEAFGWVLYTLGVAPEVGQKNVGRLMAAFVDANERVLRSDDCALTVYRRTKAGATTSSDSESPSSVLKAFSEQVWRTFEEEVRVALSGKPA